MSKINIETHRNHCCILHGCKYGNPDCPVEQKIVIQTYLCRDCCNQGINTVQEMLDVMNGKKKTCPHCGHIIE